MTIPRTKQDWKGDPAEYEKLVKTFTCPVCGKRCHEYFMTASPIYGFLAGGQWYCNQEHWKQDKNSSYWTKGYYKEDPSYKGETNERTT